MSTSTLDSESGPGPGVVSSACVSVGCLTTPDQVIGAREMSQSAGAVIDGPGLDGGADGFVPGGAQAAGASRAVAASASRPDLPILTLSWSPAGGPGGSRTEQSGGNSQRPRVETGDGEVYTQIQEYPDMTIEGGYRR